jgi:hypothetical protein
MNLVYRTVFVNLFKKPQKAFRLIFEYDLEKYQYHLLVIFGVTNVLNRQIFTLSDVRTNLFPNLVYAISIGGIGGWIGLFLLSLLIYASGKWLRGESNGEDIRMVLSYSTIVATINLVFIATCILLLRLNNYQLHHRVYTINDVNYWVIKADFIVNIILNIYFLGLVTIGLAVVQGFSLLKGLLNVALAFLLVIAPLFILIYVID